jgi:hypothetical protein
MTAKNGKGGPVAWAGGPYPLLHYDLAAEMVRAIFLDPVLA